MKIAISAESTIDMPKELLNKYDIHTVPFTVILGQTEALDGTIENSKIFEFVKQNNILPKTSAVNKFQYEEHFTKLKQNYDAIIHISLSSEFSSAFSNACEVANAMENVFVIDSRSLSTGIALLAIKARTLASENKTCPEIVSTLEKLTSKLQVSFVIDKLDYLYKGGRCSGLAVFGANLLSLKPQIVVEDGKMRVGKKYIGKLEKIIPKYCEDCLSAYSGFDLSVAFVTYTTATENMINSAVNALKSRGFENIYITTAGGTITSHCGPNTMGILFITK